MPTPCTLYYEDELKRFERPGAAPMSAGEGEFCIEVERTPHVAVLRIRGELDLLTSPEVVARCAGLADQGLVDLVVDATEVSFIDARGVSALIESQSSFADKGTFGVVPSQRVRSLFQLLDMEELIPSFRSTEDALITLRETLQTRR